MLDESDIQAELQLQAALHGGALTAAAAADLVCTIRPAKCAALRYMCTHRKVRGQPEAMQLH